MPELSIIVPVYKVEPYLCKCIDSILAQTFTDFELILIDDGSPDGCGAICDAYAVRDDRVIVIHQKNAGVSAARNAGMDIACGDYIGFVDPDDWIEPEMYETMLRTAKETGAEVVVCGCKYTDVAASKFSPAFLQERTYTSEELLRELFGQPNHVGGGVCNKLFSRSAICDIRFQVGVAMAEDWLFLYNAFLHCKNGIKIPQPFYSVVERPGSATRDKNVIVSSTRLLTSSLLLLLLCREHTPQLEGLAVDKYLDDCLRYVPQMKETGKKYHQPYRIKVHKIKWLMIKEIVRAWRLKLLPKAKLHGYIFEWIKL